MPRPPRAALEVGFAAHLFYDQMTDHNRLHTDIEQRLAATVPGVELLSCERVAAARLRLFVDHPDGVSLALCEQVTRELGDLLAEYSLEVSSPGADRPLTKPEHFRRFVGRTVRVRTTAAIGGHRSFTGTLKAADESRLTLDSGIDEVEIPLSEIRRSNLVPDHATRLEGAR